MIVFTSYSGGAARWAAAALPKTVPTPRQRLEHDALGWIGDAKALLSKGATCTCTTGGGYVCQLCERIEFAEDCIRELSGASL